MVRSDLKAQDLWNLPHWNIWKYLTCVQGRVFRNTVGQWCFTLEPNKRPKIREPFLIKRRLIAWLMFLVVNVQARFPLWEFTWKKKSAHWDQSCRGAIYHRNVYNSPLLISRPVWQNISLNFIRINEQTKFLMIKNIIYCFIALFSSVYLPSIASSGKYHCQLYEKQEKIRKCRDRAHTSTQSPSSADQLIQEVNQ